MKLPTDQLELLASEIWGKRPAELQGVFSSPLLTETELLDALRPLGERARRLPPGALPGSDMRDLCYFAGDTPTVPVEGIDPFPIDSDTTLEGYYQRVRAEVGNDFLLTGYDMQAYSQVLWERVLGFLRPLIDRVGHPPHFTRCDTFLGKYTCTPVGVHLDSAHVMTFVIAGRKRLHLWPKEVARELPDLPGALTKQTYGKYLDRAITIEATPNDLLYWPNTYWHIAENDELSATITVMWEQYDLRLPDDPCIPRWLSGEISNHAARRPATISDLRLPILAALDRFVETQRDPGFRDQVWTSWLERTSKLSFPETPHVQPAPLLDDTRYIANPPVKLEWGRLGNGKLVCAANGSSFEIAFIDGMARLLERLGEARPWTRRELRSEFPSIDTSVIDDLVDQALQRRVIVAAKGA
jgi:50S ribosomal protein L16 3-hydroxylase